MRGNDEQRLDALFGAYRAACGDPEPSANFMPDLWARIDSRRRFTFSFSRMANVFATAAVALSLAFGVYVAIPHQNTSAGNGETYIEALAEANNVDAPEILSPVSLELETR
jgi:hypothetical protein